MSRCGEGEEERGRKVCQYRKGNEDANVWLSATCAWCSEKQSMCCVRLLTPCFEDCNINVISFDCLPSLH